MKKILITILFMLAAIGAYGQNRFKYPIHANGGIRIGGNTLDLIDSVKLVTGEVVIYIGGASYTTTGASILDVRGEIEDSLNVLRPLVVMVADTNTMLVPYINRADTAGMLTNYILTSEANAAYANKALSNLASVAINTNLLPNAAGTIDLGSATYPFDDVDLDSASVIRFNNAETITHSDGTLTVGADLALGSNNLTIGGSISTPTTITTSGLVTANSLNVGGTSLSIDSIGLVNSRIAFYDGADTLGVHIIASDIEDLGDVAVLVGDTLVTTRGQYYTQRQVDSIMANVAWDSTYIYYRHDSLLTAFTDLQTEITSVLPPTFESAEVGDSAARLLRVVMSENLVADSIPATTTFYFEYGSEVDTIDVTNVSISNDTLFLVLDQTPQADTTLKLAYTKPLLGPLQDSDENEVKSFTNKTVTNNGYRPIISKIEVGEFADDTVLVVWNKYLDQDSVPPQTAFTLKEEGTTYGLNGISIGHDSLFIALDSISHKNLTYTLSYARDWPYLQDSAGYHAAPFTNTSVTNNNQSSLLTGLVAYYKLDHTSGTTATDEIGSNDGTEGGTVTEDQAEAISGRSVLFSNTGYFDMGNTEDLSVGGEGSISVWVYCVSDPTTSANNLVGKINFTTDREGYHIWLYGTTAPYTIRAQIASSSARDQFEHTTTLTTGQWYHIVYTWSDNDNIHKLYLNGGEPITDAFTLTPVTNVNNFRIGRNDYGSMVGSYVDEVGVWSRALTADEITELYNGGNGKTYPF